MSQSAADYASPLWEALALIKRLHNEQRYDVVFYLQRDGETFVLSSGPGGPSEQRLMLEASGDLLHRALKHKEG